MATGIRTMARSRSSLRKWTINLIATVAVAEILYLVLGNLLLNGGFLAPMLSRDPHRFSIEWSSGWTILPGHLRITGLKLSGQTARQQWWFSLGRGEVRLALGSLFYKTLRLNRVELDSITAGVRDRIPLSSLPTGAPGSTAGNLPTLTSVLQPDAAAPILDLPDAERSGDGSGWTFAVSDADVAQIQAVEVNGYRFSGQARLSLDNFSYRLDGPLALARGRVQLHSGKLMQGAELLAADLQSDADIRLDGFVPRENPAAGAVRFVSGRIEVSGDLASFGFINPYLSDSQWLKLDGSGRLQANLQIEHGTLMDGSELAIESPDLTLVLNERGLSGVGERHLIQGAGRVQGDVRTEQGKVQTRLQVELRDVAMRRLPENQLFLQAEGFHLGLTAPPVNLSERPGEPAVSMQWREAAMPDISLLNAYLPSGLPFSLVSGQARLNGQLNYAGRAVSGRFELAGEKISGTVFDKSLVGTLAVDLIIKQADFENRRLDFSGTRIEMQASEQNAAGAAVGPATLQTELKILQAQLSSALSLDELRRFSGQPPLSGELKLEGRVANIDFLNAFLTQRHAIGYGGGGRLRADLRLSDGHLVSPSSLKVESDRLVSRFADFEASGAGDVLAGIRSLADGEQLHLDMALRNMQIRQLKGGEVFLRGKGFQLSATILQENVRAMRVEPTAVLTWQDALMPDVALLNRYIPGEPPFSLSSGAARSSGRLNYAGRKLSGSVNLAGEKISGMLFSEPVVGQLGVDLVIKAADPATGRLDLSGTSFQMQAAAAASSQGAAPLQTRINVKEARLKSTPLSGKAARSGRLSPVSGVVRLDGSVANIAFLNRFLQGDQGVAFSGDARISAELRLSQGQVAPGSKLTAESAHLASRFLDFEASGSGVLKVAIQGDPEAPEGKLEGSLKSFGLRRLEDKLPYIRGRDFHITTLGKRLDSIQGLRDLETQITLGSAEIPDISIYNRLSAEKGRRLDRFRKRRGDGGLQAERRYRQR